LNEDIDMSAGDVLEGSKTLKEIGREIVQRILDTANGLPAKSEYFNVQEFAIPNVSVIRKEVIHAKLAEQNDFRFLG
jgi:altronate dehydratase large subunit